MFSLFARILGACLLLSSFLAHAAEPAPEASAPAASTTTTRDGLSGDYFIGPYDLLEITVFQVEDLSRTVRVNARGNFSLPLIGQIEAAGHTASDLEAVISAKLSECCMQEPQVSIFIKEFVSQRVTVEGEVAKPGIYPLTGKTTLLQAIAMASGMGQLAEEEEVRIFRSTADGTKETLLFNLEAIRGGAVVDPPIQGNDIVVVGKSGARTVVKNISDTLRGFIGFGTVR